MIKFYNVNLLVWCPETMGIRGIPLNNGGRTEEGRGGVFGILAPYWLMTDLATGLGR